jgi:hypothetical protein
MEHGGAMTLNAAFGRSGFQPVRIDCNVLAYQCF